MGGGKKGWNSFFSFEGEKSLEEGVESKWRCSSETLTRIDEEEEEEEKMVDGKRFTDASCARSLTKGCER